MSRRYNPHSMTDKGILIEVPQLGIALAVLAGTPAASVANYIKGALVIDKTNGLVYQNTGTLASATWTLLGQAGGTLASLTVTDLTTTNHVVAASGLTTLGNLTNFALGTGSGTRIGTAANQKLAFYGETPIVQPASTGETAGSASLIANNNASSVYVTNVSTFNGNLGNKAYTLNDIVKILKTSGLAANSS